MRKARTRNYEAPLNVDIPVDLREELDSFCRRNPGVKIKQFVELALRRILAAEDRKK